jgi:hypothetical protein
MHHEGVSSFKMFMAYPCGMMATFWSWTEAGPRETRIVWRAHCNL